MHEEVINRETKEEIILLQWWSGNCGHNAWYELQCSIVGKKTAEAFKFFMCKGRN
jgi:hypothetical protein